MQQELKGQVNWDTCCFEQLCTVKGEAFFNYSQTSPHVTQNHNYKPIHTFFFKDLFPGEERIERDSKRAEPASIDLSVHIDEVCSNVFVHIKKMFMDNYAQTIQLNSVRNANDLVDKLRAADYNILNQLRVYYQTKKKGGFLKYLRESGAERDREVYSDIKELGNQLIDLISITFENREEFKVLLKNMKYPESEEMVEEEKKGMKKEAVQDIEDSDCQIIQVPKIQIAGKKKNQVFVGLMNAMNNHISDVNPNQEMDEQWNNRRNLRKKDKPINKQTSVVQTGRNRRGRPSKANPSKNKPEQEKAKRRFVEYDNQMQFMQIIQRISNHEVLIKYTNGADKTLKFLKEQYAYLEKIHIFHHKFATKQILIDLFLSFKNMHTLTLNCPHEFTGQFLDLIPSEQLKKLRKLELKWDLDLFFNEYQVYKGFPEKTDDYLQMSSNIEGMLRIWNHIQSKDTVWIGNEAHINYFILRETSLHQIKHMHFALARPQRMLQMKQLTKLENLTNLKTLNLKDVSFSGEDDDFRVIIQKNNGLKTVILNDCKFLKKKIQGIIESLSTLPLLANLSIINIGTSLYIQPNNFFKLVHLESLHLSKINFNDNIGRYESSVCLTDIGKLTKLNSLGLYACIPIHSDLLESINPECIKNMKYLNLGCTSVDEFCLPLLMQMNCLEYLNLDAVSIQGGALALVFKSIAESFPTPSCLKYLSVEEISVQHKEQKNDWRFTVQSMKQIGLNLPNLIYLDVVHCNNLKNYNFHEFTALRTLHFNGEFHAGLKYIIRPGLKMYYPFEL